MGRWLRVFVGVVLGSVTLGQFRAAPALAASASRPQVWEMLAGWTSVGANSASLVVEAVQEIAQPYLLDLFIGDSYCDPESHRLVEQTFDAGGTTATGTLSETPKLATARLSAPSIKVSGTQQVWGPCSNPGRQPVTTSLTTIVDVALHLRAIGPLVVDGRNPRQVSRAAIAVGSMTSAGPLNFGKLGFTFEAHTGLQNL